MDTPPPGSPLETLSPAERRELFEFKPHLLSLLECSCPPPVPKVPVAPPPMFNWTLVGLVSLGLLIIYIPLALLFTPIWPALVLGGLLVIGLSLNPMCLLRPCIVESGMMRPVSEPTLYTGTYSILGLTVDTSFTLFPNQTLVFSRFICTGDRCPVELNAVGAACGRDPVAISPVKTPEGYQLSGPCIDQLKQVGSPPLLGNAWLGVDPATDSLFLQMSINTPLAVIALAVPLQRAPS